MKKLVLIKKIFAVRTLKPTEKIIRTTGLAGGMTWPCKGLLPAALNELEVRQLHRFPGRPLKGLPGFHFIACADRLTRKRVRCLK